MKVEVLYFGGCPSFRAVLPRLRELMAEHGADPDEIILRRVETLQAAEEARFLGSPSVRIDGHDVEPGADERDDFGLKCRIYRSEDGLAATPPERWIHAAMSSASRQ